jgi:hypothetical protein
MSVIQNPKITFDDEGVIVTGTVAPDLVDKFLTKCEIAFQVLEEEVKPDGTRVIKKIELLKERANGH